MVVGQLSSRSWRRKCILCCRGRDASIRAIWSCCIVVIWRNRGRRDVRGIWPRLFEDSQSGNLQLRNPKNDKHGSKHVVFSPSLSFHTSVNSQFQAQRSEKGFAKCRTLSQTVSCHRTPLPGSTAPTHLENRGTPSHCQEEILIPPSTRYPQLYPPLRLDIPLQTQRAWRHTMKRVRIFLVEIRGLCYTPARFQSHSVSIPHQV